MACLLWNNVRPCNSGRRLICGNMLRHDLVKYPGVSYLTMDPAFFVTFWAFIFEKITSHVVSCYALHKCFLSRSGHPHRHSPWSSKSLKKCPSTFVLHLVHDLVELPLLLHDRRLRQVPRVEVVLVGNPARHRTRRRYRRAENQ